MLCIDLLHSADFTDALYRYRQEQQTLAGLSLTQIEEGILNNLQNKNPSEQVNYIDFFDFKTELFFFMTYFKG